MKITANMDYFLCAEPAALVVLYYCLLEIVYTKVLFDAATCCKKMWCKLIPNPATAIQMIGFDLISRNVQ